MIELSILKLLISNRDIYNKYILYINKNNIDKTILNIVYSIVEYYKTMEDHNYLSSDELRTWFFHLNPNIKDAELYNDIFERLDKLNISDSVAVEIIKNLIEKEYANKIVNSLIPVLEDKAFGVLHNVIRKELESYEAAVQINREEDSPFVEDDLESVLEDTVTGEGFNWRLACLTAGIGPLRGGSLGHIFARPDTGKTSFIASEATHLASQLQGEDIILWVNNEEKASKVKLRTYQACLNTTTSSIVSNVDKAKELYKERGGTRIRIYDSATVSVSDIESLIKAHRPRIIIIDQGDKVSFYKDGDLSNADRLQKLYQAYRELAKKYDCDIITVGQANGEAEGRKWLEQGHMNNSKTGKPGELDYAIGIGTSFAEGDEDIRYIHICKNKYGPHSKHTVLFDAVKSRYKDI